MEGRHKILKVCFATLMGALGLIITLALDIAMDTPKLHIPLQECNRNISLQQATRSEEPIFKVPNIVHYIWYQSASVEFRFDKALGVLSAIKLLKPEVVYFHTNHEPFGKYYEELKSYNIFKVVKRSPPTNVIKKVYHETDYADYDRVNIVLEQGGIYLDFDALVMKSFDELRKRGCTLGEESAVGLGSGTFVCAKGHPFLYMWKNYYFDDWRNQWAYNSNGVATKLAKRYPQLVHIEKKNFFRPNFYEIDQIWGHGKIYNLTENYTLHTYIRLAKPKFIKDFPTPESIKKMNSTFGQVARRIYYGSTAMIYD